MNILITIRTLYLQKIRSNSFVVMLGVSILATYIFIPTPDASYSTLRLGNFTGTHNSVWTGYMINILLSLFLSFFGYFLILGGIKKDGEMKLSSIIFTTPFRDYYYLMSKFLSSFLFLLTASILIVIISFCLQIHYSRSIPGIENYIKPFIVITFPSLFLTTFLAIFFEIIFKKLKIIQYVSFLIYFIIGISFFSNNHRFENIDPWGIHHPISLFKKQVTEVDNNVSIGFVKNSSISNEMQKFDFKQIILSNNYIKYRFLWILFVTIGLLIITPIFSFTKNFKTINNPKIRPSRIKPNNTFSIKPILSVISYNFGITRLAKIELYILLNKTGSVLNILSLAGMVLMTFTSISFSYQFVLPILFALQTNRISDLITKDFYYKSFASIKSSFKPLERIFMARLLAAFLFICFLMLPLLIRVIWLRDFHILLNMLLGGGFIILLSITLGTLSKTNKIFEVTFIIVTYFVLHKLPFTDYLGVSNSSSIHIFMLLTINISLFLTSFIINKNWYK